MKAIKKYRPTSSKVLIDKLLELSLDGNAYTFSNIFGKVTIYQAKRPCDIPDYMVDETRALSNSANGFIAYKGVNKGHSKASMVREQNRGMGCE